MTSYFIFGDLKIYYSKIQDFWFQDFWFQDLAFSFQQEALSLVEPKLTADGWWLFFVFIGISGFLISRFGDSSFAALCRCEWQGNQKHPSFDPRKYEKKLNWLEIWEGMFDFARLSLNFTKSTEMEDFIHPEAISYRTPKNAWPVSRGFIVLHQETTQNHLQRSDAVLDN